MGYQRWKNRHAKKMVTYIEWAVALLAVDLGLCAFLEMMRALLDETDEQLRIRWRVLLGYDLPEAD